MQMGVFREGSPSLSLYGTNPKIHMGLAVLPWGSPNLRLRGVTPVSGFDLGISRDDAPEFTFVGDENEKKMSISGTGPSRDYVALRLSDKMGKTRIQIASSSKITNLSLFDAERHARALIGLTPGRDSAFMFYDRALTARIQMTTDVAGLWMIRLNDPVRRRTESFKPLAPR
jgi:hypothetical protein